MFRWLTKKRQPSNVHSEQDLIAKGAIKMGKMLGAQNARDAAEMTMGRELNDDEWNEVKQAWERNWS